VRTRYERGDIPGFPLYGRVGSPIRFKLSVIEAMIESWQTAASGRGDASQPGPTPQRRAYPLGLPPPVNPAAERGRLNEE
jgi:hypothetical protein